MNTTDSDLQAAMRATTAPDVGVMYGRDALNERVANAIAAERERVIAIKIALVEDARCDCSDCIRDEAEQPA